MEMARLRQHLADRTPLTIDTIPPLPSAERVMALARIYEQRLDHMRRRLFISAPPAFVGRVTAFQGRWGGLAAAIRDGQKPPEIERSTWSRLASGLSGPACTQASGEAAGPVKIDGARWACLSDNFLREQAAVEGEAEGNGGRRREQVLAPLTREMASVRERLLWLRDHATVAGEQQALWRRDMTWRLNRAFIEGAKVRLGELQALQAAAAQGGVYRDFFGTMMDNADTRTGLNPPDAVAVRLPVPPRATVEASLDHARAPLVALGGPDFARLQELARALSATHHRLRTFEPTTDPEVRQDLEFYRQELERADIRSGDVDLKDPARANTRKRALDQRVRELRDTEQGRLEQVRESLLRALTSAAS
ncbi:MAG TPA: hypothetical protein VMO26_07440 [Vicinamibacterales bacterium]|nr:hypothetical protein [Vicinamibacterales bacterium]